MTTNTESWKHRTTETRWKDPAKRDPKQFFLWFCVSVILCPVLADFPLLQTRGEFLLHGELDA